LQEHILIRSLTTKQSFVVNAHDACSRSIFGGYMHYGSTTTYNDSTFQMIPPLFQPLRLWTPRVSRGRAVLEKSIKRLPLHAFTIKGGFVNCADGERRMVIAGKIFRRQGP
jgi:hypothetical protein